MFSTVAGMGHNYQLYELIIKPMILSILTLIFTIKSLRFFAKQDNNINEIFKNNLKK